jgi:pyruvate/2-oxoglutarate dehydrogenase complex dihydrolipoamide dehydrogenase (E3) component
MAVEYACPGRRTVRPDRSGLSVASRHQVIFRRILFGAPVFKDEHSIILGCKTISARNGVIATGSSSAVPPIDGLDKTTHLTNHDIFYIDKLPSSLIIMGGGPIGIEMAQAFSRLGTKVTVLKGTPQILDPEDQDLAEIVQKILEAEGVSFHVNTSIVSIQILVMNGRSSSW